MALPLLLGAGRLAYGALRGTAAVGGGALRMAGRFGKRAAAGYAGAKLAGAGSGSDEKSDGQVSTGFGGLVGANISASTPTMGGNVVGQGRFVGAKAAENNGKNSTVNRTALESSSENLNDLERELIEIKEELKEINAKTVAQKIDKPTPVSEESIKAGFGSKLGAHGAAAKKGGIVGLAGMGALLLAMGKLTDATNSAGVSPENGREALSDALDSEGNKKSMFSAAIKSAPSVLKGAANIGASAINGISSAGRAVANKAGNVFNNVLSKFSAKKPPLPTSLTPKSFKPPGAPPKPSALKAIIKTQAKKGIAFTAAKGVPLLGALASSGAAMYRMVRGDFVGAGIDTAAALTSFTGFGTPVAIAAAVTNLGRDIYKGIDFNGDGKTYFPETDPEQDKKLERSALIGGIIKDEIASFIGLGPEEQKKEMNGAIGSNSAASGGLETQTPATSASDTGVGIPSHGRRGRGSSRDINPRSRLTSGATANTNTGANLNSASVATATDNAASANSGGGQPIIVNNTTSGGGKGQTTVAAPAVTVVLGDQMKSGALGSARFVNGA